MSEPRKEVLAEGVEIWLGDCREVLPMIGRVDAVVTDPPYGMGLNTNYSGFSRWGGDEGTNYAAIKGDDERFDPSFLLALNVPIVLWGSQYFVSNLPDKGEKGGWLVFNKRGSGEASKICFGDAELAWCSSGLQSVRMYSQMWHGVARWSSEGAFHPTQKPVGLMRWCIEQISAAGVLCDPYLGSGPTGVAAVEKGLGFVGIEIDANYFDIACRRISEALRRPRLPLDEPAPQPKQEAML